MGAVLVQISGHGVVHDEVERGELPIGPVHGQVPQLGQGQLAVVKRVEQEYECARHNKPCQSMKDII